MKMLCLKPHLRKIVTQVGYPILMSVNFLPASKNKLTLQRLVQLEKVS